MEKYNILQRLLERGNISLYEYLVLDQGNWNNVQYRFKAQKVNVSSAYINGYTCKMTNTTDHPIKVYLDGEEVELEANKTYIKEGWNLTEVLEERPKYKSPIHKYEEFI